MQHRGSTIALFTAALLLHAATLAAQRAPRQGAQQPVRTWTVSSAPTVRVGDSPTVSLAVLVGASRLPNGSILASDRSDFGLLLFDAKSQLVRRTGRKGKGPGEFSFLYSMMRCGDSSVTVDIDAQRVSLTTAADVQAEMEREIAVMGERSREMIEREYKGLPHAATLPATRELLVDVDDNLWVQHYPRAGLPSVRWSVFSSQGTAIATVQLPSDFELFKDGRNYVLGRYIDKDEQTPELRMYRLSR